MKKSILLAALIIAASFLPASAQKKASSHKPKTEKTTSNETYNIIKTGKGMDGITVGKSTKDDVIKKFGKDFKWLVNKKYSYQLSYPDKGLAFYICQSDKKSQIFVIEIKRPYRAKTDRGIILGKSNVAEIVKAYGKAKSGLEYRGIGFYYSGANQIVSEIDISESRGMRQCAK